MVKLAVTAEVHASSVKPAQSLIQGHLAEMQSETATLPEEGVTGDNPTTSETEFETTSKTPVKAKDWGGAQPKTRQQNKAKVTEHMNLFDVFLKCISETLHTTCVYIYVFVL